jgi:Domain of unknown function (DUF4390)
MNRRLFSWTLLALLMLPSAVGGAESLHIVPIVHEDEVLVSIELNDAYTDAVRETISSGLRTTFTYEVDLRMLVPAWVDRTIVSSVVSNSDQFDNLTRRHSLSRTIDGRVESALVTEDESVAKRWLTTLTRLPLCRTSKLEAGRDYYVRIRARTRPYGSSLLGWASAVAAQTKFTFIP